MPQFSRNNKARFSPSLLHTASTTRLISFKRAFASFFVRRGNLPPTMM